MDLGDVRIAVDVFVGMMAVEVVVKPIAIVVGRALLRKADRWVNFIPDWLYSNDERPTDE